MSRTGYFLQKSRVTRGKELVVLAGTKRTLPALRNTGSYFAIGTICLSSKIEFKVAYALSYFHVSWCHAPRRGMTALTSSSLLSLTTASCDRVLPGCGICRILNNFFQTGIAYFEKASAIFAGLRQQHGFILTTN
jgi:hypothetical protein